jgi:hypothetical protein
MKASWDVAQCSLGVDRRFGGAYCIQYQGDVYTPSESLFIILIMEVVCTSETSAYSNVTTRRYFPEGSDLHTLRRENLKYHILSMLIYTYFYISSDFLS